MGFKVKKTISINSVIRKGEAISFIEDCKKISVVYSCQGRRTEVDISGSIIKDNSDYFKIFDIKGSKVDISVNRGSIYLEKIIFFEEEKKVVKKIDKNTSKSEFEIFGELF